VLVPVEGFLEYASAQVVSLSLHHLSHRSAKLTVLDESLLGRLEEAAGFENPCSVLGCVMLVS